jgi:hypothetical protein
LLVGARVTAFGLDRGHEPDRGEIVFSATLPAFGETPVADQPVVLRRKRWLCGNGRIEGFILFGLKVHLCLRGGFRG